MAFLTQYGKIRTGALVFTLVFLIFPTISLSSDAIELQTLETQKLTLVSGKSIVLRSTAPVSRVSIAAPEVADFLILSANEIYITQGFNVLSGWLWTPASDDEVITLIPSALVGIMLSVAPSASMDFSYGCTYREIG